MLDAAVTRRVQRILEIPGLIDPLLRKRTALRAERRTAERKLKAQASLVRSETLRDADYLAASNQTERDILLEAALHNDDAYLELSERVDQLTTAIEKAQSELDVLDHERKALKAALEREYAEVISNLQSDKILAGVATSRQLPKGVA